MKTVIGNIFGTSKVVTLNAYTIITYIVTYIGYATGFLHFLFPANLVAILVTVNVILSEVLNYFFPSGAFIGHGQNWTIGKWILNIGLVALAYFQAADIVQIVPATWLAVIVPVLQLVIRIFGNATPSQVAAAAK